MTELTSDLLASGFHDTECAGYRADLPYWVALADTTGGPIVDIGAGTGRVSIPFAQAGHEVVAVDLFPELLTELERRAASAGVGAQIRTVAADARSLGPEVPAELLGARLVAIPMQTIQLLGGPSARVAAFAGAAQIAAEDGELAVSIVSEVESFDGRTSHPMLLPPDVAEIDGFRFESTPLAVLQPPEGGPIDMHRRRVVRDAAGVVLREPEDIVITLDPVTVGELALEAAEAGWNLAEAIDLPATDDHAGGTIVTFTRARGGE